MKKIQNSKARKLADLTDKALDKLGDVMDMSADVDTVTKDGSIIAITDSRIIGAQVKAAGTVISAQMRADENALREVQNDGLRELLALLRGETVVRPLSDESAPHPQSSPQD